MGGFFIHRRCKSGFFYARNGRIGEVMAEETTTAAQESEQQAIETETDWQAKYEEMRGHMRDWEKKAKANQNAADELEKLKAAQMTEQEKANARAEAAEQELEQLKAEKAKVDAATKLASETGVPFEMLMFCADADAMADFAKQYAKETHVGSVPTSKASRIITGEKDQRTSADVFADFASDLFK
jgi:hypothetical protein